MRKRLRVLLSLTSVLSVVACGDEDKPANAMVDAGNPTSDGEDGDGEDHQDGEDGDGADGQNGQDGEDNQPDGDTPDGDDDGSSNTDGDAGADGNDPVEPEEPTSNSPNATILVTPDTVEANDLDLVSANLLVDPSGDEYFEQWYAVIKNNGTSSRCHVQAEVSYLAGTTVVTTHYGFASAAPFEASISLPVPCIAPGEIGIVYSNGFSGTAVNVEAVTELQVTLLGNDYPEAVPHPLTPTLSNAHVITTFGPQYHAVSGTLTASGGDIYNIGLDVFPYDLSGLVFERLTDTNLNTVYSGASWPYETSSTDLATFTEFEQFVDFIPGTKSGRDFGNPVADLEDERRSQRSAARLRKEAFLGE